MAEIPWKTLHASIAAYCFYRSTFPNFLALSAITIVLRFSYAVVLYPVYFSPLKNVPTPTARSWMKGNLRTLTVKEQFDDMRRWNEEIPNDGLIRFYIAANLERLIVTSSKALSEILVQKAYEFEKPLLVRRALGRVTGEHGVLLVEGAEHKRQRKSLMPAFAYRHIKNLYPVFWSKSIEMVKLIEQDLQHREDPTNNVICIENWVSRATLDIIGVTGMNRDFNSLHDPSNDLAHHYHRISSSPPTRLEIGLFLAGLVLGTAHLVSKLPFSRNRLIDESADYIRNVARQMIREARETTTTTDEKKTPTDAIDIISVALESDAFTEEELIDQMMTFLAAGHETTSSALQWCIYTLCKHPDVQTRLREEIRSNLPSISLENPSPLSAATIDALPYLHAVCNEVLRFHPSAPNTIRIANRDTTLVGQPIPKGTVIQIVPAVTNRDKALWGPDADQFNPERWLGPGQANTGGAASNYAFLTFIHGPRSCIGQGFAKGEMACLLAALVGRFRMELEDPDKELVSRDGATTSPLDGVRARLEVVEGW
ncbi:cytochrome P450 monooxygenase [Aspergillus heteromorphus CBS 117.55]|uniref:Cytochrome P450 monooxygenase n=1 Tax=Aspergillus heteromorphus CBS 117.55 TaxID=1448321 RepID=A0A317VVM4_9EURO|nr:cytochrome P450 monooxygenase [Aspergillus heteromorphus CBS 117.55]PWY78343.1 cytochrome P450 monooxygenase [Aspergillus heteromorphus CBS 117.55]